ncbi:hypothetical protein HBIAX_02748 [Achromobacter xylosoxidans]|nr:hypothetical protein HBIAX_02748 [Achromobacter xylosoxidans]
MGCRGRVRRSEFSAGFFCWREIEFLSRPAGRRQAGAGLRLRSGAFAPDCPCLILVLAFGDSFGFRRAHLHAPPPPAAVPPGSGCLGFRIVGARWVLGMLGRICGGGRSLQGPPKPAARAAFFGLRGVLRSRMTLRACGRHERLGTESGVRRIDVPRIAAGRPSTITPIFPSTTLQPPSLLSTRAPPLHPRAAPALRRTAKAYAGTGCPRSRSRRATQDLSPHSARAASPMQMSVAPGVGRAGGAQPRYARGNLKAVAEGDNEDDKGGAA